MSNSPRKLGRVRYVLEVETPSTGQPEWVRLTTSIPGRQGALTRVWTTPSGRMSASDWDDLVATVLRGLSELLELMGGSQGVLPL